MSLTAYTPLTWVDYADSPDLSAANLNHLETGVQAVTTELITFEGVAAASYQPLSSELTALSGLSAAGYVKRTGSAAYSVVASIPQSDVSGLVAALATIPGASSTTPAALGASGAVGTGTTWARADHVHIYPTAAQVGAEAALGNPGTSGYVLSSTTGGVRSWVASVASLAWSAITSKPTTLAGYGITDAQAALGYTPVNKAGDTGVGMLQVNYTSTTSSTRGVLIGSIGNYLSSSSASLAIGIPTAASNWPLEIQKNGVTIFSVDTTGALNYGIVPVARITGLTGWATNTPYTNGSTTDVAEGTNLYFTSARAIAAATPSAIGALALAGGTMNSGASISFANVTTGTGPGIQGTVGDNDFWRFGGGATATNSGYAEIATADDGTEPIYVRQYTGVFATLVRTATLLDGSGNTSFPGSISEGGTSLASKYAAISSLATVATSGSASDLGSGILGTGRMPGLTGDVTSSAGGVATTLAKIQGVTVATLTSNGVLQYVGGSIAWTAVPSGPVWSQVGVLGGIGYGSAGQVMLSAGASTAPVWTNPTHSIISDWNTATSGFVTGGPYQPLNSSLSALSAASVAISSSAGAANFFSDVATGDAVMRWGSPYTETVRLGVMSNSSGNNASSLWFSASSAGSSYTFSAPSFSEGGTALASKYQPLENQRLSTSSTVTFSVLRVNGDTIVSSGAAFYVQGISVAHFGGATWVNSTYAIRNAGKTLLSDSLTCTAISASGAISSASTLSADKVYATNNGNGTNYAVGDDLWIGDINLANGAQLKGQSDPNQAYLKFGTSGPTIGYTGSGALAVAGDLSATGNTSGGTVGSTGDMSCGGDLWVTHQFLLHDYVRITAGGGGNVSVTTLHPVISAEAGIYNPTSLSTIPNGTLDGQQVKIINNGPSTLVCSFGIRSASIPTGLDRTWTWNAANAVWL